MQTRPDGADRNLESARDFVAAQAFDFRHQQGDALGLAEPSERSLDVRARLQNRARIARGLLAALERSQDGQEAADGTAPTTQQLRCNTDQPGATRGAAVKAPGALGGCQERGVYQIVDVVGVTRGTADEAAQRCSMAIVELTESTDLTCRQLPDELGIRSLRSAALRRVFGAA